MALEASSCCMSAAAHSLDCTAPCALPTPVGANALLTAAKQCSVLHPDAEMGNLCCSLHICREGCLPACVSKISSVLPHADNEKRLTKKVKELNNEIVANAAKVQTALRLSEEDQSTISTLKTEVEKAWRLVDASHEKVGVGDHVAMLLDIVWTKH